MVQQSIARKLLYTNVEIKGTVFSVIVRHYQEQIQEPRQDGRSAGPGVSVLIPQRKFSRLC